MYCGDETGSFIGDVGSKNSRFGYGGEDNPKLVFPSYVSNGHLVSSCLSSRTAEQEVESILKVATTSDDPITDPTEFLGHGDRVNNWDALEVAWNSSMETLRAKDPMKHTNQAAAGGNCAHPILAVTPGFTEYAGYGPNFCKAIQREDYSKMTEMLFESMGAPAVFLAPSTMLSAFSMGRQTALIVDIGAGGCRVTPIVEGLVLENSQRRTGRGGEWMNHVTWKALLQEKVVPKPHYQVRSTSGNKSVVMAKSPLYHQWAMQELILEFRTGPHVKVDSWCQDLRVPFTPPPSDSDDSSSGVPESPGPSQTSYTLPDGTEVDLSTPTGRDFCRIPELFFSDDVPFTSSPPSANLKTLSDLPLQKLIQQSLLSVGDVDVRKDLAGCVCLVGNGSQGLEARLSAELTSLLPTMAKPKVTASRNTVERSCAAWIGASVLTSLGSFQQLWLSKTEYEEYGSSMAMQRFP